MARRRRKRVAPSGPGAGGPSCCPDVPPTFTLTLAASPEDRLRRVAAAAALGVELAEDDVRTLAGPAVGAGRAVYRNARGEAVCRAGGGDAVSESWGYRCETCGEDGPVDGYNGLAVLRREWEHALAFRVISRRHDLPGDGHNLDLLGEFADRHRTHDVTAVCLCGQRRSVPLFPGNAPLPRGSRGFLHALADDCLDVAALGVFFDVLEEAGHTAAGLRVRKLTPRTGDVLVVTSPDAAYPSGRQGLVEQGKVLRDTLKRQGREIVVVIHPAGTGMEALDEEGMGRVGWVRAERVAEAVAAERERIASRVEGLVDLCVTTEGRTAVTGTVRVIRDDPAFRPPRWLEFPNAP